GGEAQRLKLASELLVVRAGQRSVILLDEPTTGLHPADVQQLIGVLQRLVRAGNAVVVIEHNTDVLEACDRLVELGPEGGAGGGMITAEGTPRELLKDPNSITGPYLFVKRVPPLEIHKRKKAARKKVGKKQSKKKATSSMKSKPTARARKVKK
ncbi:MAG: excinuclease ABC subunit A, partial [Candidatus Paceibacteria bacterium]